ncbi:hypothetical protein [uncultured Massilia sp.]|uniref:hypothetical protein n=1 Tax=uncultured Massilia sp. TaxID=169973 RepID=UPI0025DDC58D|nr:hypothetical protein [uncultured Massilia sp.]
MVRRLAHRCLHVLMLVMAFQLSWNVVTAYCMHESGRAANHLGHHRHAADADELAHAADAPDPAKPSAVHDVHCVSCAHIALAAPDLAALPFGPGAGAAAPAGAPALPASVFAPPPERPQWAGRA